MAAILDQIAATVPQRTWTMDSDKQALLILDPTMIGNVLVYFNSIFK
jgi:hypothetical protein